MSFTLKKMNKKNELNKYGIFLLDIYLLDYYGVKVFFQVCKTTTETVYLVELATKTTKYGIMLTKTIKASKKPIIIHQNNTYTKSNYEVRPINLKDNEIWLPIEINYNDPIYIEAKKYYDYPAYGFAYAVPITDVLNKYWEKPVEKNKEKEIIYYC